VCGLKIRVALVLGVAAAIIGEVEQLLPGMLADEAAWFAVIADRHRRAPAFVDIVAIMEDESGASAARARCGIAAVAVRSGRFTDAQLQSAGPVAIYDDVAALLADYAQSPLGA
jgi:hypothetical protein